MKYMLPGCLEHYHQSCYKSYNLTKTLHIFLSTIQTVFCPISEIGTTRYLYNFRLCFTVQSCSFQFCVLLQLASPSEMSNKERKRCPGDSLPGKRLSSANNAQMAKCSRWLAMAGHSLPPPPYTVHNFCFSLKFIEKFQRKNNCFGVHK
jgi:hypothetical protein